MAAVPLFSDTNMAAVTSRENVLFRDDISKITITAWLEGLVPFTVGGGKGTELLILPVTNFAVGRN